MTDDLSDLLKEIMALTGGKQAALGKRLGVSQSTIWRWLNDEVEPSASQFEEVKAAWRKAKGYKQLSLDQKIAPYDSDTQATIHHMVDNYLRTLPPPPRR